MDYGDDDEINSLAEEIVGGKGSAVPGKAKDAALEEGAVSEPSEDDDASLAAAEDAIAAVAAGDAAALDAALKNHYTICSRGR